MTAIDQFRGAMMAAQSMNFRDVLKRDPCVYCCAWPYNGVGHGEMTMEHIKPVVERGVNNWRNLAGAHASCNRHRGRTPLVAYLLFRHQLGQLQGPRHKKARERLKRTFNSLRNPETKEGSAE